MLTRLVSLLLAATIFGCPLVCGTSSSCCAELATVEKSCCDHCQAGQSSTPTDDSCPDDDRSSEKSCQCICGGAVVEERDAQVLTNIDFTHWFISSLAFVVELEVANPPTTFTSRTPLPDDGANPGRLLRCQLMSFLC